MSRKTLILKGFVVGLLLFTLASLSRKQELVGLLVYGAPYLVALFLPERYISLAAGICLGAAVVELPFTAIFSFFGGFFPDPGTFIPLRILSVLLVLTAAAALMIYHGAVTREDRVKVRIGGVLSAGYIVLATLVGMAATRSTADIPMHATEILGQVDKCAIEFAKQHAGSYPASLSELGPEGSGCLGQDFVAGRLHGLKLRYYSEGAQRNFTHYHVTLERNKWFNRNEPSFYSDESGIIHKSFGGHIASRRDTVVENPSQVLRAIAQCLIDNAKASAGHYPARMEDFPANRSSNCSPEFMSGAGLRYSSYGSRISYAPKLTAGDVVGFVLEARPNEYGKDGVRSYMVDETGIVRATPENRPARPDDPPIPVCEHAFIPCVAP